MNWMVLFIELLAGCAARFKGQRKNGALAWMKRFRGFLMGSATCYDTQKGDRKPETRPGPVPPVPVVKDEKSTPQRGWWSPLVMPVGWWTVSRRAWPRECKPEPCTGVR